MSDAEYRIDRALAAVEEPSHRHYCVTCNGLLAVHWATPQSGRPWRWWWAVCRTCKRSGEQRESETEAVAAFNEVTP